MDIKECTYDGVMFRLRRGKEVYILFYWGNGKYICRLMGKKNNSMITLNRLAQYSEEDIKAIVKSGRWILCGNIDEVYDEVYNEV